MVSHLLDTSVYSQPLKQSSLESVDVRWERLGDEALAVSVICEAEVLFGLEWKNVDRLRRRYTEFLEGRLAIIPLGVDIVKVFANLKAAQRREGRVIPDLDLLIAATAKAHRLILATLNYRHFEGIEGLAVEDWSRE